MHRPNFIISPRRLVGTLLTSAVRCCRVRFAAPLGHQLWTRKITNAYAPDPTSHSATQPARTPAQTAVARRGENKDSFPASRAPKPRFP